MTANFITADNRLNFRTMRRTVVDAMEAAPGWAHRGVANSQGVVTDTFRRTTDREVETTTATWWPEGLLVTISTLDREGRVLDFTSVGPHRTVEQTLEEALDYMTYAAN